MIGYRLSVAKEPFRSQLTMVEKMMDPNLISYYTIDYAIPSIITIENRYQISFCNQISFMLDAHWLKVIKMNQRATTLQILILKIPNLPPSLLVATQVPSLPSTSPYFWNTDVVVHFSVAKEKVALSFKKVEYFSSSSSRHHWPPLGIQLVSKLTANLHILKYKYHSFVA